MRKITHPRQDVVYVGRYVLLIHVQGLFGRKA